MTKEIKLGYGYIPYEIMTDTRLTPHARLLYGYISSYSQVKGYCWSSNGAIAGFFNVSNSVVRSQIAELRQFGYVRIEQEIGKQRNIFCNFENNPARNLTPCQKSSTPPAGNLAPPLPEIKQYPARNLAPENLKDNIKDNSSYYSYSPMAEEKEKNIQDFEKIIMTLDEVKEVIRVRTLQEEFYYKIGDEISLNSTIEDFLLANKAGKFTLNSSNTEKRFRGYLKPKQETEEDRNELKKLFNRKKHKNTPNSSVSSENDMDIAQKEKAMKIKQNFDDLPDEVKDSIWQEAKEAIEAIPFMANGPKERVHLQIEGRAYAISNKRYPNGFIHDPIEV